MKQFGSATRQRCNYWPADLAHFLGIGQTTVWNYVYDSPIHYRFHDFFVGYYDVDA